MPLAILPNAKKSVNVFLKKQYHQGFKPISKITSEIILTLIYEHFFDDIFNHLNFIVRKLTD